MSWEIACADMCRACMKVDGVLLPMYDDDTISTKNLPDKLAELASIQIDRFDGLPNMLCAKCAYRTDAFYDFKLQVQATDKKLRKMFETQIHCNIKEEVLINEYEQDCTVQPDDTIQLKLLNNKLSINSVNNADNLEDSISDVISINDKGDQQTVEIDVSEFVQNGEVEKPDIRLRNILLPKVQEASIEKQIKNEIPDEISKILESEHMDYTIMYIPETDIESLEQQNGENTLVCETEDGKKILESCTADILQDTDDSGEFLNTVCVQEAEDDEEKRIESEEVSWESIIPKKKFDTIECINERSNERSTESKTNANESDGSDSDYFVDPKDNILGSLNDMITRIKEVKLETGVIQYQCTLCLQNYDKLTGVLLHTIDNHVPSSGPFFCVVCEKDCDSHRDLRAHVKIHTGQFPYSCFICNKAYTTKRYLKRHMVCHTDFHRHRCPKCGLRFKVKSDLESHIATHIRGAPYACSQCPRLFNHKGNYKRHLISHLDPQGLHLPKYPCKVCGKRFLNNRTLDTHMRVHTGEKPFKCEVCGRSFSQQGNLLNHVRIHSNPRSYTCEVCGKRFNQRATLRDHSLLHTGEKPYVCNVCGIAFTFSAALRRHMWTHTGGKPFGCEICDARFVGKYDLRRHMSVHSDRPRAKRRKYTMKLNEMQEEPKDEIVTITEDPDTQTVMIEQVLLTEDVTQVARQQESEKENVDALFNLIQYG